MNPLTRTEARLLLAACAAPSTRGDLLTTAGLHPESGQASAACRDLIAAGLLTPDRALTPEGEARQDEAHRLLCPELYGPLTDVQAFIHHALALRGRSYPTLYDAERDGCVTLRDVDRITELFRRWAA